MIILTKHRLRILLVLAMVFLLTSTTLAASEAGYQLNWYTMDGGGGNSSGGIYALSGTIGQADAGLMSGGSYTLVGGFWAPLGKMYINLYLPFVRR